MQNSIRKFRKSCIFLRNQVLCLKNWKLWRAPTTIDFNNFCWTFAHVPYLPISIEECLGFFKFCLELELFAKIKKYLVSTHSKKPVLLITLDLKNSTHPFVDIRKKEMCAKFQQKILNSTVVGACQIFQFFRQITWFLRNTRALSKFKHWILHHIISIIKLQNN